MNMSSIPGYTLEKYVAWNHNLIVQGLDETNVSVGMAESLGLASHQRSVITEEQFAKIVRIYEPHREAIENWLDDFDEEHQSWRDYSGYREDLTNGEFMNVVLLIEAFQRPFPLMSPLDQRSYWFSRDTKVPNGRMSSALEVNFRERAQILYEFCDLARKADYHAFFEGITLVTLQEFRIPGSKVGRQVLQINFFAGDYWEGDKAKDCMSPEIAKQIKDFVESLPEDTIELLVNCGEGMIRSYTVCEAIHREFDEVVQHLGKGITDRWTYHVLRTELQKLRGLRKQQEERATQQHNSDDDALALSPSVSSDSSSGDSGGGSCD